VHDAVQPGVDAANQPRHAHPTALREVTKLVGEDAAQLTNRQSGDQRKADRQIEIATEDPEDSAFQRR
jgi:hypothetical protein